jgi:hypothetical protein
MKRGVIAVLSAGLLLGAPVFAQQDTSKPNGDEKKISTADPTGQMKTVEGTVKEFEAGKRLVLTTIDNKTMTYKLDQKGTTLNIDPSIAVGSHVKVMEQKSGDTKSLTVEPVSKPLTSGPGYSDAKK